MKLILEFPDQCPKCSHKKIEYYLGDNEILLHCQQCQINGTVLDSKSLAEGLNNELKGAFQPENLIKIDFAPKQ